MPRFKKKPVVVEAIQIKEKNIKLLKEFCPDIVTIFPGNDPPWVEIKTFEGIMRGNLGDWVIKGVENEFYPCKNSIFESIYEPAPEESNLSQTEPSPKQGKEDVYKYVLRDIAERVLVGKERYGTYLQTFNGRNPLIDAYQEALDLVMYLRQAILEIESGV